MEINLRTLPEHYSDYFYESLLDELPEALLVGEIKGKIVHAKVMTCFFFVFFLGIFASQMTFSEFN